MNISDIAKKYRISESFLTSKEDALSVVQTSLKEFNEELKQSNNKNELSRKINVLVDFLDDIRNAGY